MPKTLLHHLQQIISQFRFRLVTASCLILISNLLLIINPLIFRQAILTLLAIPTDQKSFLTSFSHAVLGSYFLSPWAWGLLLFLIAVLSASLKYRMRTLFFSVSREVELELREKLFNRIQNQSRAFFDQHSIGGLLSLLTNDITTYRDMLGPAFMYPMHCLTLIIPSLIALYYLSPLMTVVSLIPIVGIFLVNQKVKKPLFDISEKVQQSLSEMSVMAHEHFSGLRLIRSYGIEISSLQLFQKLCRSFSKFNVRFGSLQGILLPSLTFLTKTTSIVLVVISGGMVLLNWGFIGHFTTADFLSFMWIQSFIFTPLLMLSWIIPLYQRGDAAYQRLIHIYDVPIEIKDTSDKVLHIPTKADIHIKDLSFTYPGQARPLLSHFNLHIKGGSFIGITGPVGAGKSTLLRLLSREYEVFPNTIFIAESDIHCYSLNAFQRALIKVEQHPFLFSKTIFENIRFGKQEASLEEVEFVSRLANLHTDVLEFPNQYETLVGERGASLSGGQKQRVAIARAFLVNRSILLMDDIFASLDTATEKKIFNAIKSNFKDKTVLLVTHRISILEQLDRVLYMYNGKIIEDGTPQQLILKRGPYRTMAEIQNPGR